MRANRLKRMLKDGRPAYGLWVDLGSVAVAEALASLGFDWLLLDAEHGVASFEECQNLLRAMNGSETTSLIRVPYTDRIAVKRALDMGAEGVLVPYVKTVEQVREVISWCRYPPVGTRGLGPFRASKYETDFMNYYTKANDEVLVMAQIETVEALECLDEILALPGLDAIFIGPADLAATMGHFPDMNHPAVQGAVDRILQSGQRAGVPVGYYCSTGEIARRRAEQGFLMANVGNDMVLLTNAATRELAAARGGKAAGEVKSFT